MTLVHSCQTGATSTYSHFIILAKKCVLWSLILKLNLTLILKLNCAVDVECKSGEQSVENCWRYLNGSVSIHFSSRHQ